MQGTLGATTGVNRSCAAATKFDLGLHRQTGFLPIAAGAPMEGAARARRCFMEVAGSGAQASNTGERKHDVLPCSQRGAGSVVCGGQHMDGRSMDIRLLSRSELPMPAAELARWLVGKTLVRKHRRGLMSGRIVETEAYVVGDASSHAYKGKTARNASLFLGRGHAYVYFIYGCWFSLNVTAGRTGTGTGVLLRALEQLEGVALMARHRPGVRVQDLARGPGRLATALDITRALDGHDLCAGGLLWLGDAARPRGRIGTATRIGISRETDRMPRLRPYGDACESVSDAVGSAGSASCARRSPHPPARAGSVLPLPA
ncbi:DNA-3-methyladenine glycosylase [Rhodospirillales bacterium URHD0017]|nr:DNA-3-methyladenine glycosylase [Rhodospirillales bacterium URHD0017]